MTRPDASAERMLSVTKRYGLSVVLVLSALLVTLLVRPETLVGPVFFLAVILSAWLGGVGPGLVATLVATLTIDYFFLPPKYSLRFNPAELPELLAFLVSAVVVSVWSNIRNRTERLLRRTRDELEERMQERSAELSRSNGQLKAEIAVRERVAAELRDTEERFRVLSESSLTGVYLIQEGRFRYVNPAMARMFGYTVEEVVDRLGPLDLVSPDDRPIVAENIHRWVEGEVEEIHYELRGLRKDGSMFPLEVHGCRIDLGGKIGGMGTLVDNTERKRAELERQSDLRFLEGMDRVNQAMQGTNDFEQMMSDVLDAVLAIFDCDRAWLVHPCDPLARTWRVAMEHTRPEFPWAFALQIDLPVDPEVASVFETARSSSGAVRFDPGSDHQVPVQLAERFSIRSMIVMVLSPKIAQPYLFGLHQCSGPRVWTPTEERLFQEIGRRLEGTLTSVLIFRSLRESERRLDEAQRIAHLGYWDRDLDAGRITLSDEGCRIFGFPPEERILDLQEWHERWQALIHAEDRPRAAAAAAAALAGGPRYDVEYRVIRPNGEVRTVHSQGDVIRDASGRPCRMFGIMQDITERKRAEAELRASEERFRMLVQFSFDVYWESDAQHRFTRQEFAQGLANAPAPGSEIGKTRWEVPYLEPDEEVWREHRATLDAHLPFRDFELARPTPDGGKRYVSVSGLPVFDATGGFLGYRGVGRDITDRKRSENALRKSQAYLAEAQRLSHTGSWSWSPATRQPLYWSEEMFRIFGLNPQEGVPTSETFWQRIHPEHLDRTYELLMKAALGNMEYEHEHRIVLPDGTVKHIHAIGHPVLDENGQVAEYVGTAVDVTERKRAEEALRRSEAYLAEAQRLAHTGSWAFDVPNNKYIYASEECLRIFELDAQEGLPTREAVSRLIPPEDWDRVNGDFEKSLREKVDTSTEFRIVLPSGTPKHIQAIRHPVLNDAGEVVKLVGTVLDITERKRAEEALRQSETRFRTFVDHATDAFFLHDEQLTVLDVNRQACESLRYSREELIGMHPRDFDVGLDEASIVRLAERVGAGETVTFESLHRRKEGTVFPVEIRSHQFQQGEHRFRLSLVRDISERKQAEERLRHTAEALQASEAYLAEGQRLTQTGSWALDVASGTYVYSSEENFRIYGFDPREGLPTREALFRRIHPEDRNRWKVTFEKSLRERVDTSDEYRIVLPDGTVKHIQTIRHPVLNDAGDVVQLVGTSIDITDRKRAEEALRRSEAYLAEGQRLSHAGSWAWNPLSEQCFYWSEEMFRIFEIDPQQGLPTSEIFWARIHPEDRESMREVLGKSALEKTEYVHDHRILLPDGTVKHIHAIGHPVLDEAGELVEFIGTAIDVTERKRAEEERDRLRQLEAELAHINRVSLMGELASSIAHEVNQPLSGVVSNANACLRWLAGDAPNLEEVRETARRIVRDGKRAAEVIARIRALAKRAETPKERLDLNETMREVLVLVGDEAKRRGARIHTDFDDDLSPVAGDQVQLQQVVLNLVMNGIEAMSSVGERVRELVITTRNLDPDQVQVTVDDSGIGLDPDVRDKIFDPFYTTKPGGMGMGLSISRSILEAHGGRLWATAKDGPGAVFHFTLPRYHEEASNA